MLDATRYTLINLYIGQFGWWSLNGSGYMTRILQKWLEENITLDAAGIRSLISYAAHEKGIQPYSIRKAIRRYSGDGWKRDPHVWKKYTGWNQDRPPDVDMTIKLLCKSYADYEKNFETKRPRTRETLRQVLAKEQENGAEFPPAPEPGFLIEDIIASNLFLPMEDNLTDVYGRYLAYRVQRDFYEICREKGMFDGLSWKEFVFAMRRYKRARDISEIALQKTVETFHANGDFNFGTADKPLYRDGDLADIGENDVATCASLLTADKRQGLALSILLRTEIAHYRRQLNQGKNYSWKQYLTDVLQNREMWDEIMLAFRDAMWRLDFKPVWQSEELEELVNQLEERGELGD